MALTPEQIANAVSYYSGTPATSAAPTRGLTPDQITNAASYYDAPPPQKIDAFAGLSSGTKALKGSTKPLSIKSTQKAASPADSADAALTRLGWFNPLANLLGSKFAHDNGTGSKSSSIVDDALAPQGTDQAPKNATQWILNALSTGSYASGRFLNEIGHNVSTMNAQNQADSQNRTLTPGDRIGKYLSEVGQATVSPFAAAARGVAEGFGARFNNQKPITPGADLQQIGATKGLTDAVTGATGNAALGNWAGGALGFAGDVALDPTTYIGGLGALKGLKVGTSAAAATLRAGGRFDDALTAAVHAGREGAATADAAVAAAKLSRVDRATAIPTTPVEQRAAETAVREAALNDLPTNVDTLAADAKLTPTAAPITLPKEASLITPTAPHPQQAAIDSLLPTLATKGRTVDPAAILSGARSVELAPAMAVDTLTTAKTILHDAKTVPEVQAGLKLLKMTPEGKSLLSTPIKVGDAASTVGQSLEHGAMARITGGSASGDLASAAVDTHLNQSGAIRMLTTPSSLRASIATNVPELGTNAGPIDVPALMGRLATVKSQPERQTIVSQALGVPAHGFKNFDEAINASVHGQVEASAMRSMLKALGIKSSASRPDTLRSILAGRGALAWDEIQKGVPTAQEVLDNHSVPAPVAEAAKLVNVSAERAGAARETIATVNQFDGVSHSLFNAGIEAGHADEKLIASPTYVEGYGTKQYNTINQPVIAAASKIANSQAAADGGPLTGIERGNWMYDRVMPVLAAVDKAMLSEGRVARLQSAAGQPPFYATLSDITSLLHPDTVKAALFNLDYRLTDFGEGYLPDARGVRVQSEAYKAGDTVYPTTIAYGAKAAMEGKDPLGILNAMGRYPNKWEATDEGQAVLRQVAAELSQPDVRAAIREMHTTNQTLAVANAQKAATDFVNPIASDIMAGVAAGGDRSKAINPARAGAKKVADMATAEDDSLVQDMAGQRLHNGTVAALGEDGVAMARSDARATDLTPGQQHEASAKNTANQPTPDAPPSAVTNQKVAEDLGALSEDAQGKLAADAQQLIDEERYPDTPVGHIEAGVDASFGSGFGKHIAKLGDSLNEAFNGLAGEGGYDGVGGVRLAWTDGGRVMSHDYGQRLGTWVAGGGRDAVTGEKLAPLGERIQQALGLDHTPDTTETQSYYSNWMQALQQHQIQATIQKTELTDAQLTEKLLTGQPFSAKAGAAVAVPPLEPGLVPMALELQHHIDEVMSPVNGAMTRLGANPADVLKQFEQYGTAADYKFNPKKTLAEQASFWHKWDVTQMSDPLDVLHRTYGALMASSLKPAIANSAVQLFSHVAEGVSRTDAIARGYRSINPETATGLFKYVDNRALFPKDVIEQMKHADAHSEAFAHVPPDALASALKWYDRGLDVLKQSMTSVNPSHWVTNVLGDAGFNMLEGVDPRNIFPAMRMMFKANLLDKDPALIDAAAHNSGFTDATKAAESSGTFLKDSVPIHVGRGDKLARVDITLDQLKDEFLKRGVFLTGHMSNDQLTPSVTGSVGDWWDKVGALKFNPSRPVRRFIDKWSATRDNATRLTQGLHVLRTGKFDSLDAAYQAAAAAVHRTHPTGSALSKFERSGVRRVVTFYSWQRLALGRVLELAMERPGLVTVPSKYQYEQAQAAGFDPESIGKPFGNDARIASYEYNGIYGPTFIGGYSPLGGTGDLPAGSAPHQWGFSLSSPAMDALSSAFQGVTFDTGANMQKTLTQEAIDNISPLITDPIKYAFNTNGPIGGVAPQSDPLKFALDNSGAPGRIAKAAGLEPKLTPSGAAANTPAQQSGDNARQALNYLTGIKATDYTNDTSAKYAAKEQGVQQKAGQTAAWQAAGYTPAQIKAMLAASK
jgi:hypothetical protein